MKNYMYVARDFSGIRKQGLREAASSTDVLSWLREQGFTPVSINEISAATKESRPKYRRRRIKSSEMAAFCWQLATMIEGGIPITAAIETIAEDIENSYFQNVLSQVLEKIRKGETISDSISEFPMVFSHLFRTMILAGETGGTLPTTLRRLAEYFDNRDKLAKKVRSAMAYPTFIFVFIVLLVIFIMTFIIPRFRVIFKQIRGQLPAFTRAFMGFYDIISHNIVYIIGFLLLALICAFLLYSKTKKGHYLFSKIVLSLPLLGRILSQAFVAMFCRTMATLIAAGVSVLEVFDILSTMARNDVIKDAITQAKDQIVEGSSISVGMGATGFFPNMLVKMVQVGEESGSLPKVLDKTADFYERKVDATITTVMGLLEPIMIVTVGAIVLVVVLALYLPIFSMSEMAG